MMGVITSLLGDWDQFSLAAVRLVDKRDKSPGLPKGSLEWIEYFLVSERLL